MTDELGAPVEGWSPPPVPPRAVIEGRYCRLEPLTAAHAGELFQAFAGHDAVWDYMPVGPFGSEEALAALLADREFATDPLFFAIRRAETGRAEGMASYLRINPEAGSIEVGWISYAPALQRTRAATEAMVLMTRWAFEAGYRRYEWKCNALNMASRRAAQRLGLSYEGVFRQATVVKGRNRDTAWFAAIDSEWPRLEAAFETWLDPTNFDAQGRQRVSLSDLTAPVLVARDPVLAAG